MLRSGDTLVVRWVDRLGRNYADVTDAIRQFMRRGVIVRTVINGLVFDGATKDPMQKAVRDALIAFMAATAEAQAEATREAQKAGIAHAKATEPHSYRGRKPSFDRAQLDIIRDMLARTPARPPSRMRREFAASGLPGAGRSCEGGGDAGRLGDVSGRDQPELLSADTEQGGSTQLKALRCRYQKRF